MKMPPSGKAIPPPRIAEPVATQTKQPPQTVTPSADLVNMTKTSNIVKPIATGKMQEPPMSPPPPPLNGTASPPPSNHNTTPGIPLNPNDESNYAVTEL